uniref:Uncharacterized protein n=1 Tax=Vararia minispora EC-137 TaxID=1314806 RepID=A0ACB8QHC2_9AGAM|nr:hypothetical protein K488DRAFT_87241 [Vararia minispora EC-137]
MSSAPDRGHRRTGQPSNVPRDVSPAPSCASSARSKLMYRPATDDDPGAILSLPPSSRRRRHYVSPLRGLPAILPAEALRQGAELPPPYTPPRRRRGTRRSSQPVEVQPRRPASQLERPPPADYEYLREAHDRRPRSEGRVSSLVLEKGALLAPSSDAKKSALSPVESEADRPPELMTFVYKGEKAYVRPGLSYEDALDAAQDAFPALRSVSRLHITLHVGSERGTRVAGAPKDRVYTRVARDAWVGVACGVGMYGEVCVLVAKGDGRSVRKLVSKLCGMFRFGWWK